jgi:DNA-binding transcriptional LysR family regulator
MDRFSELRAFVSVIDAGGFSAAARESGQSRSAVNRLVISLEERLGVQLLNRTTRSVSPTSNGRAVYDRARQVLEDLEEMERSVTATRTEAVGRLRINAPLSFGDLNFSELATSFLKRHPQLEIDLQLESRLVDPVAEGYDVVVRIAQPDEETTFVDHRILELEYVMCASPEYLLASGIPQTAKDLRNHAVLEGPTPIASPVWTMTGPDGLVSVPVRPVLTANTLETRLMGACAGLGIAILPAYGVRSDIETGRLRRVLADHRLPSRMLQVIYPPARHLSAKVRLFLDFVEAWCHRAP